MKIIIGAGGGYDILSAAMMRNRMLLENADEEIDIGGFLNPKFVHFFPREGKYCFENIVNKPEGAVRFRECDYLSKYYDEYQICKKRRYFVDSKLAGRMNCQVYVFSLRFGIENISAFLALRYEEVIFCDVGGDILFFGDRDRMVKTPVIDACAIRVGKLYQQITAKRTKIILLGAGLDGELPYDNLKQNLDLIYANNGVEGELKLYKQDIEYLEALYYAIAGEGEGNTCHLLIDVGKGLERKNDYYEKRKIQKFTALYKNVYILNLEIIYRHNPLCLGQSYSDILNIAANMGVSMERY